MKPSMTTMRWLLAVGLAAALIMLVAAVANAQPPVPHPVEKGGAPFEDCLGCHRAGIGDALPVPGNHRTYDNDTCATCHGATGVQPPTIPHPEDTEGTPYENCVGCHSEGLGDAPVMPADHEAHDSDVCALCHGAAVLAGPIIPHPEEREGTPFEDCVFCHRSGLVNAPLMPTNHQAHDNEDCALCHATAGLAPPGIPHMEERTCADCHRTGAYGAHLLPPDHQSFGDDDCFRCHSTTGVAAPVAPTQMNGRQDCMSCHHDPPPEGVLAPVSSDHDHSLYTSDTCLSCHRLASETEIVVATTDQTPAAEVPAGSLQLQVDEEQTTRDALAQRWAIILVVSAVCVAVFTLLRRA